MKIIRKKRKALGIIAAILIILFVAVIAALLVSLLGSDIFSSLNYLHSQRAFFVAESGIEYATERLQSNSTYRASPTTLSGNLGNGNFSVSVVDNGGDSFTLTSLGLVESARRAASQTVVVSSAVLNSAIHGDGANVNFNNSTGTINGNISCHSSVQHYSGMTINGTVSSGVDKVNPSLDFDYYKSLAQSQGQYYTNNRTLNNTTINGVYYTTGRIDIGSNVTVNGAIFAESNIRFSNNGSNVTINSTSNYPVLASQSSITTQGSGNHLSNSTINGLIYVNSGVNLDYLNGTVITGIILADQGVDMTDSSNITVTYNAGVLSPMPPGFTYTAGGQTTALPQGDWNELY